jgi:hypothetical protein
MFVVESPPYRLSAKRVLVDKTESAHRDQARNEAVRIDDGGLTDADAARLVRRFERYTAPQVEKWFE